MHHLMPALPRSRALTRVICKMAPFDVLYGTKPGCATNALVEAMFTIAPAVLAATMALAACLVAKEVPLTFVPNTWSQSARSRRSSDAPQAAHMVATCSQWQEELLAAGNMPQYLMERRDTLISDICGSGKDKAGCIIYEDVQAAENLHCY